VNYTTVYRYFSQRHGRKLKAVRPSNVKKDENLISLFKKSGLLARLTFRREPDIPTKYKGVDFISEIEMRLSLKTDLGKKLILRGVKPIGKHFSY
jgi:hypothetical protein